MVGGDDLAGGHGGGGDVGDVALQTGRALGSGQAVLVQGLVTGVGGDEPGALGAPLAGDHCPGPVLLSGQRLVVPGQAPGAVGPDRPPRARISGPVPDGLLAQGLVALLTGGPAARGEGLDDLPVGEGIAVPAEVGGQVPRGALVILEPTMKPRPTWSRDCRLAAESMPASATITRCSMPAAALKSSMMGISVAVSALSPSQQPIRRGKPARSTSRPMMIWGSTRRSLE